MLEQLPNELLQIIIEYVGPPFWDEHARSRFQEDLRQRDLSSLSLVSQRLRSFAQPLLFAVLSSGAARYTKWIDAYASDPRCRDLVSNVRSFRLMCQHTHSIEEREGKRDAIRAFLKDAEKLEEGIYQFDHHYDPPLPLSVFSGSALKRLHLDGYHSHKREVDGLYLPHLTELSLSNGHHSPLEPHQLPSLCHLGVWGLDLSKDPAKVVQLFDKQLKSIQSTVSYLPRYIQELPDASLDRVLFDLHVDSRDLSLFDRHSADIVHLRICDLAQKNQDLIKHLFTLVRKAPLLRTVYVETENTIWSYITCQELRRSKRDLTDICRGRNIELVEERQMDRRWHRSSRISPDFTRRMSLSR